jgi:hypothetical protein
VTARRPAAAMSAPRKRALYGATAVLWMSGAVWLYRRTFCQSQGPFGPEPPAGQAHLLKIHGAAAMVFLVVLGGLISDHVPAGWRMRTQRPTGGSLVGVSVLLAATGWGLYYLGGESSRAAVAAVHDAVGLALPVILFIHIKLAARKRS